MRGNRKGPENLGPKTGRGLGFCNGNDRPGFESDEAPMGMRRGGGYGRGAGFGRGRGPGRGMRQGFGRGYYETGGFDSTVQQNILDRLEKIEKLLDKGDSAKS
ncbi:DUF5320 domain-containing protein [Spirochaeta isovalerica]|uniref:Uncharacterized protein n=1 Tax=Spirochaeta isovalerica TaxID=150 RepID=A0A841RDT4_9SPIO|nr:DUF5320 domain-containing protein [Spirochaeta isovalerica]MBB6481786.1 hypothetical protein [Spirochaeta isovalerica]